MNLKNLNDSSIRFLLAFLLCLVLVPGLHAQDDSFSHLKQVFEKGKIFNASFHHQSVDSYTQDTVSSNGFIWVGESRYKVRAEHQSVVVNGKTSMVYDDNRNRVIISKYDSAEDDFAPSRILNGVDSTFTVQTEEKQDDQIYILLTSDDPFAIYKKVELYVSTDLVPQKIRAVDPVDNVITTTFNKGRFINSREGMFLLDYPDGAEVVDLRN